MTHDSMKQFRDTLEAIVVALLLAFVIRAFVVQAFKIPSGSMLNTLLVGDHLLVTKFAYDVRLPSNILLDTTDGKVLFKTGDPQRGDICVFKFPEDESKDYIKRVIGLPGETVEIRNRVVYINGEPIEEPYVFHKNPHYDRRTDEYGPVVIPEGQYLMLGDNREGSSDSRFWGFVKREKIVGKALVIYWSWANLTDIRFSRIGTIFD